MSLEMNDELVEMANDIIEKSDKYFYKLAELHGKKGFVWIKNDETSQLSVYTRGEYTNQIICFLESLDENKTLLNSYRDALLEILECGTLERAEFIALNAIEGK